MSVIVVTPTDMYHQHVGPREKIEGDSIFSMKWDDDFKCTDIYFGPPGSRSISVIETPEEINRRRGR